MSDQEVLRQLGKKPNQLLGQNFLQDKDVIEAMVETGELSYQDVIVEIGPGTGALTRTLCQRSRRVIAIERDLTLAERLRNDAPKNLTIVRGDALQVDWTVTVENDYKIVASIPYSITSPLLRKIMLLKKKPARVVLLVQKEVAERLVAPPGSRDRGVLTIMRESQLEAKIVRSVPPEAFYPQPKVDSAIIVLWPKVGRSGGVFWPAVEAAFRHKRQTIANGLKDLGVAKKAIESWLKESGLPTMARPERLSFEQWVMLGRYIQKELSK